MLCLVNTGVGGCKYINYFLTLVQCGDNIIIKNIYCITSIRVKNVNTVVTMIQNAHLWPTSLPGNDYLTLTICAQCSYSSPYTALH
jgi:hypothetical protein